MENTALTEYMTDAMENIVTEIMKKTLKNPKETAFLLSYREEMKSAAAKRRRWEEKGEHIPSFIISSITDTCNLFCKGCYARANGICGSHSETEAMTADQWDIVFEQCADLGIGFHLLAGGEPFMRKDVLAKAAKYPGIIFPVFTNGTLFDEAALDFFDAHRNLVPVLSVEGTKERTDARRGEGVTQEIEDAVKRLKKHKILFGVSLTVTTENLVEVTSERFIRRLYEEDCRVALFIEYVPVEKGTQGLALGAAERQKLAAYQTALRNDFKSMVFLSFPGDEVHMGGCLGAGRGFLHISPEGRAEACPFSPYADRELKTGTLREALHSPFFERLRNAGLVGGEHDGGCALFEHENEVKELWEKE